jgi:threonine/homoserine/homoserine lactone efflux protein
LPVRALLATCVRRGACSGAIVSLMLPIASSSGPAFIAVVVIGAALLLWWLLRAESRDEARATSEQEAEREAEQDRLSAP